MQRAGPGRPRLARLYRRPHHRCLGGRSRQQVFETEVGPDGTPVVPPFDDPSYDVVEMRSQANDLETRSREQNAKSRDASRNAARYGGLGVIFIDREF